MRTSNWQMLSARSQRMELAAYANDLVSFEPGSRVLFQGNKNRFFFFFQMLQAKFNDMILFFHCLVWIFRVQIDFLWCLVSLVDQVNQFGGKVRQKPLWKPGSRLDFVSFSILSASPLRYVIQAGSACVNQTDDSSSRESQCGDTDLVNKDGQLENHRF